MIRARYGLRYHLLFLSELFRINVFVLCDVWSVSAPSEENHWNTSLED